MSQSWKAWQETCGGGQRGKWCLVRQTIVCQTSRPGDPDLPSFAGPWIRSSRLRATSPFYEVDPLVCPRCTGPTRIIAFIEPACADTADRHPDAIEQILTHLGLWPAPAHSPPAALAA